MELPRFADVNTLTGTGVMAPVRGSCSDETTGRLIVSGSGACYQSMDVYQGDDGPEGWVPVGDWGRLFAAGKRG